MGLTAKKKSPLERNPDGTVSWTAEPGDRYLVTGTTPDGRRFKQVHSTWRMACGINLWRGRKWLLRDGKRHLINRTWN